jgi:predicted esterase YcpF (UPF0227 family)
MILYLHGFRSSPQSFKARLLGERMQAMGKGDQYICPQLPASPQEAIDLSLSLVASYPSDEIHVVGSSLGGFYATHLAERLDCRAVLLNPAVKFFRDLEKYVGVTTRFHTDEPFEFKQEYIDELRALAVERITAPERYFLMAATGDEVLDWREMVSHYPGARHHIIEGSDHGISEFADYADEVLAFCGVLPQGQS